MEKELEELIKSMILLKNDELNNITMSCDAVEGFLLGTFYNVQEKVIREDRLQKAKELIQSLDPRFQNEDFEDIEY